jgi:hypothetical protein
MPAKAMAFLGDIVITVLRLRQSVQAAFTLFSAFPETILFPESVSPSAFVQPFLSLFRERSASRKCYSELLDAGQENGISAS